MVGQIQILKQWILVSGSFYFPISMLNLINYQSTYLNDRKSLIYSRYYLNISGSDFTPTLFLYIHMRHIVNNFFELGCSVRLFNSKNPVEEASC